MHYSIAVCCDCTRHFSLDTRDVSGATIRTGICVERESMNLINIDDRTESSEQLPMNVSSGSISVAPPNRKADKESSGATLARADCQISVVTSHLWFFESFRRKQLISSMSRKAKGLSRRNPCQNKERSLSLTTSDKRISVFSVLPEKQRSHICYAIRASIEIL
jgi:hypothetical protein